MQVTVGLMDLLLKSVDVMRDMLRTQQAKKPIDAQRVADLQFDLELAVAQKGVAAAPAVREPVQGFAIRFKPMLHLLARGNDPLRIFAELRQLGELDVRAESRGLPSLQELDPETCYLSWQLELATEAPRAAIELIFEWAEGDCELESSRWPRLPPPAGSDGAGRILQCRLPRPRTRDAQAGNGSQFHPCQHREDRRAAEHRRRDRDHAVHAQPARSASKAARRAAALGPRAAGANIRELQESVMRVRMLPISFVFSRFPRLVRDLSTSAWARRST